MTCTDCAHGTKIKKAPRPRICVVAWLCLVVVVCVCASLVCVRENQTEQVSVMARMKADDKAENGGGPIPLFKKLMAGHAWREFLQVSSQAGKR